MISTYLLYQPCTLPNLHLALGEAKYRYKQHVEEHQYNSRYMWQGIKTLTSYKDSYTATNLTDDILPDTLKHFFSQNREASTYSGKVKPMQHHQHQVRSTLCGVNVRKAAGPDGVTERVLNA